MVVRKVTLSPIPARGQELLRSLLTEARASKSAYDLLFHLISERAYLTTNLLKDSSEEYHRALTVMARASRATTIKKARKILREYLQELGR